MCSWSYNVWALELCVCFLNMVNSCSSGWWSGHCRPTEWSVWSTHRTLHAFFLWVWAKEELCQSIQRTLDAVQTKLHILYSFTPCKMPTGLQMKFEVVCELDFAATCFLMLTLICIVASHAQRYAYWVCLQSEVIA